MDNFVFQSTPRVLFGSKMLDKLAEEIESLSCKSAFFICDPAIYKMEFFQKLIAKLAQKIEIEGFFTDIISDPGFEVVDLATSKVRETSADIIIGIGGGSTLDIAKIIAITAKTGEGAQELTKKGIIAEKGLPLILIPTTAGTGSEVTHISILSDNEEKLKTGLVSTKLYADVAILDPDISLSLPKDVTAFSGIDAIIHAIEALTSKKSNKMTDFIALEALEILFKNILVVFENGKNKEARGDMLYGSMLAGKAFANSSVAGVHAFAYPIGAEFHIPHGLANSIMVIPVLRYNLNSEKKKYAQAAKAIGINTKGKTNEQAAHAFLCALDELIENLKVKRYLRFYGVTKNDIPRLAKSVMKITRLLDNNPKKITIKDAEDLYMEAL